MSRSVKSVGSNQLPETGRLACGMRPGGPQAGPTSVAVPFRRILACYHARFAAHAPRRGRVSPCSRAGFGAHDGIEFHDIKLHNIELHYIEDLHMGKGDRKTAKGKRYNASYGNARLKSAGAPAAGTAAVKKAAKPAATKAPAKKVVAKKAAKE